MSWESWCWIDRQMKKVASCLLSSATFWLYNVMRTLEAGFNWEEIHITPGWVDISIIKSTFFFYLYILMSCRTQHRMLIRQRSISDYRGRTETPQCEIKTITAAWHVCHVSPWETASCPFITPLHCCLHWLKTNMDRHTEAKSEIDILSQIKR